MPSHTDLRGIIGTTVKWLEEYHELAEPLLKFEHPAEREQFYKFAEKQLETLITQQVTAARIDELRLVDAAYHSQIDMKIDVSTQELLNNDVKTITVDDPRTQNDLFRHVQYRLATLQPTTKQEKK